MIPQLVTVRGHGRDGRRRRLVVPVLPVVLLLSPLLLLVVLAGVIACRVNRISPVKALRGLGRLLWALPGTRFHLEHDRTAVQVDVR